MQALVYGKDKPHNVALLVLDPNSLATRLNVSEKTLPELYAKHRPAIEKLVQAAIERTNKEPGLKHYERVGAYFLLDKPLTIEDGFLTQKLSIKRPQVIEKYGPELLKLYDQ